MHQLGCNTNTFSGDANICLHLGLLMTRRWLKETCSCAEMARCSQRNYRYRSSKQRVCLFCLRNEKIKQSTKQNAATGIDECHIITNYVTTSWRVTWLALYRDKNIHRNVCYRRSCVAAGDGSLKVSNRTRKVDQIFCYFTRICCDLPSPRPLSCWSSSLPNLKYHLKDLQIANPET